MAKAYISLDSIHLFRKKNGATLFDEKGQYDLMKCSECGIEGKCRDFKNVEFTRNNKKIQYCTTKPKDIKVIEAQSKYAQGDISKKHKCPNCKTPLSEIALWVEEGTEKCFAEMVCKCGYRDLFDVTAREKKKEKTKKKSKFTLEYVRQQNKK